MLLEPRPSGRGSSGVGGGFTGVLEVVGSNLLRSSLNVETLQLWWEVTSGGGVGV